ncbi:MAG: isoprenoid biosynthesis protein ElbB, partial [Deltaproteobacteria bacterium]|nr:isoprenoid biosynthesis protein ElbB [Deltaproteobacteria bacterium]
NVSTFPDEGADCTVNSEVEGLISEFYNNKKPIGGICIAPAVVGKVFQNLGIKLTVADGGELFSPLKKMGHELVGCSAVECIIDNQNKFISTPAYISAKSIGEVWLGIEKLVNAVVKIS